MNAYKQKPKKYGPENPKAPDFIGESAPEPGPRTQKLANKLPMVWEPRFLDKADSRYLLVQLVRKRVKELEQESGADSLQKRLLCSRAAFICCLLESMEVKACETGRFEELGAYAQSVNVLIGLFRHIGLERHTKSASLSEYLKTKEPKEETKADEEARTE